MELIVAEINIEVNLNIESDQESMDYLVLRRFSKEASLVLTMARVFMEELGLASSKQAQAEVRLVVRHTDELPVTSVAGVVSFPDGVEIQLINDSLEQIKIEFSKIMGNLPEVMVNIQKQQKYKGGNNQEIVKKLFIGEREESRFAKRLIHSIGYLSEKVKFDVKMFNEENVNIAVSATPSPEVTNDTCSIVANINYVDDDSRHASIKQLGSRSKDFLTFQSKYRDDLLHIQKSYFQATFQVHAKEITRAGSSFHKVYELVKIESFQNTLEIL